MLLLFVGGYATADWLQKNLENYIKQSWQGGNAAIMAITEAFLTVSVIFYITYLISYSKQIDLFVLNLVHSI